MVDSLVISAVGDINLGDRAVMVGLGVRSHIYKNPAFDPFVGVQDILSESDLTFGNLECVLSDFGLENTRLDSRIMRAPPKSIQIIKRGGIDLLSVANNHIMQHGSRCYIDTIKTIQNEGIVPIGVAGEDKRCIPQFVVSKGLKIGFLGYSLRPEKYTIPPLYACGDLPQILAEIQSIRQQCSFVIVSLHWGDEYMTYPAAWQIEASHNMIDCGASVVLGHHPHVLQGVEKYNGGVIAYSLGNFVFDVWQKKLRESMVLQISFSGDGVEEVNRIPIYIASNFAPQRIFSSKKKKLKDKFNLLDGKLQANFADSVVSDTAYRKQCLKLERINQLQNRLLFLWQLPKYQRGVALQCLLKFFDQE